MWRKKPRCPKCRTSDRVRTHMGGVLRIVYKLFDLHPFRCESCGTKFYRKWRLSSRPPRYPD